VRRGGDRMNSPVNSVRERLVIVGNGMASVRLVEHLAALGYPGRITVLGDEPHAPYNRILLSAVLEGTHLATALTLRDSAWYAEQGVDLRLGTRVTAIDRTHQVITLTDDTPVSWDRLVVATGSTPALPPIRGLISREGELHPAVHAFRSLADCRRLESALPGARRAVVVGGGLLGLQVARALSVRGIDTEIVEGARHLLSRQLGPQASAVVARELTKLGTAVYTGARAVRVMDSGDSGTALQLDNGAVLSTDLVILAAGGRPAVSLARNAGLTVRRGVVVGQQLESVSDHRIHALGDCAEYSTETGGRTSGFVAPAWEQAGVLAEHLVGKLVSYTGSREVARLRASGLDVAVLGNPEHAEGDVVEISNPIRGSHRKLVVRSGVIVAAALVGDLSRVGLITQLYDSGTHIGVGEAGNLLLPDRPLAALLGDATLATDALPDDVEVCSCAGVNAGRVRACVDLTDARCRTRATTGCGSCAGTIRRLIEDTTRQRISL
jgi:assimilatory nitrate reductase electron transfer subunit